MAFVQFTDVSLAFGARDLLKGASLFLAQGSRSALAGPNGAGKSTLMKIAAGILKPDSGECAITKGARISYLPQMAVLGSESSGGLSVYEEAEKAFSFGAGLIERQEELGRLLGNSTEDDGATRRLLEEHAAIQERIEGSGYWNRGERIREVLHGLGFRDADMERPAGEFSGGWQMRVALAKVLLENPDVMLLDEPTNYLDLEARSWLEGFLADYAGAVLVVSHDRYFLDVTVREVYELWNGRLSRYPGSYSAYEARRAQELAATFEAWERQQEEIARLEEFIRRFRYQATKASLVQSRVKQLEKVVPIEIPEGMKKIHFAFPPAPRSGKVTVKLAGIEKSYGANRVIQGLDLEIERGMKVAFVGPNGAGKSTLMRLIAGADREYGGEIRFGSGVEAAYFAQDTADLMDGEASVEEEAESLCPTELLPKIRNLLGAFLFRGDDIHKSVRMLSGGERSRLALLKMLLRPANLLILDEPTNHLDLTSKDVLLEALRSFEGTVLFVSHDRSFIEELADRVLELEAGSAPRWYVGDYRYFLEKKAAIAAEADSARADPAEAPERRAPSRGKAGQAPAAYSAPSSLSSSYEEEKARKARLRKLQKREEEILSRLEAIGAQKAAAEREMGHPANYADGAKMKRLAEAVEELDREALSLNSEWELVAADLAGD
ncbi:MAG TPA: ABC-F family ATP-binding cassette domain-containing protein [Rectinemataceae bacterium]|nr:ABC-F family ATP-binding cassette domain-containing protein [Rectinemataceae bacterium]